MTKLINIEKAKFEMDHKDHIYEELCELQCQDCEDRFKFQKKHLKRLTKYIDSSIVGDECCMWTGYICNTKKNRIPHINFNINNKKYNLHRLIGYNFLGMKSNQYIKYTCENKGRCLNINHYQLFDYLNGYVPKIKESIVKLKKTIVVDQEDLNLNLVLII